MLPWGRIGALSSLAAGIVLVPLMTGREDLTGPTVAAGLIVGATVALAFDEPARAITDAAPIGPPRRRVHHLGVIVGVVVVVASGLALVVAAAGEAVDDVDLRLAEMAAASGVSAAVASGRHRRGAASVSVDVALAGPLAVLFVSALAQRLTWLPSVGRPERSSLWWLVAALTWATALWSARDLYHHHQRWRRGSGYSGG